MTRDCHQLHSLDMLCGSAVLLVAIYHSGWIHVATHLDLVRYAGLMVDLFFVLSGFVICHNYDQRIRSGPDVTGVMKKRFWPLRPLHMFTIVVFVGIACLRLGFEVAQNTTLTPAAFSNTYVLAFFANAFLVHSLGSFSDMAAFNAVSWSISVEFYTYLILALLCLTGRWRFALCALAMLVSVYVLFTLHGRLRGDPLVFEMFRSVYSFGIGVLAYHAFLRLKTRALWFGRGPLYGIGGALFAAVLFWAMGRSGSTAGELVIPLVYGVAIVAFSLAERKVDFSAPLLRPFLWMGLVSCSIYMVRIFRVVLDWDTVLVYGTRENFDGGGVYGNLALLVYIALIFAVSALSFRDIEDRYRKGIGPRRQRQDISGRTEEGRMTIPGFVRCTRKTVSCAPCRAWVKRPGDLGPERIWI